MTMMPTMISGMPMMAPMIVDEKSRPRTKMNSPAMTVPAPRASPPVLLPSQGWSDKSGREKPLRLEVTEGLAEELPTLLVRTDFGGGLA
jgi:hypothetical protein